jgi:dephospho-CoA kinase
MICRLALTGGIACGKSLAGAYLKEKGLPVIDADDVVHELLRDDGALKAQIKDAFGADVFDENGQINRPALGKQVFANPNHRRLLESWIHPKTRQVMEAFYHQHQSQVAGVCVIPLLFESGLADRYDQVWLLDTPPETQLRRLTEKRGMSQADALARIQNQMSREEKQVLTRKHPHGIIIDNQHESPEILYGHLDALLKTLPPAS